MPGLGSPHIRHMRRIAAAHAAWSGRGASRDPEELLACYDGRAAAAPSRSGAATLSRRDLLQRGAVAGAGVLGASVLGFGARPARAHDARVVVVGAGLAGLTCAYRLAGVGVASDVYEARDRVGGRCWTIRVFERGQTAEHGGQYIDSRHRHIRALASELGLDLVDTWEQSIPSGDQSYLWLKGAFRDRDKVYADYPLVLKRLERDYRRVGSYLYDRAGPAAVRFDRMSVTQWLDENVPGGADSLLGRALERSNTGFFGLDGNELSAINLFEFWVAPYPGADERYRVAGGNDRIPHRLADRVPHGTIRFGRPLEAAWTRRDGRIGLRFAGTARDVVADVAVLTLPFTVLRDVDISGLEMSARRRRAIETLAMGTNSKLQFQLEQTLKSLDWTGDFGSDEPEYTTWDSSWGQTDPAPRAPVITVWTGGEAGASYPTDRAHGIAPPRIVDDTLNSLARGVKGIHGAYNGIAYLDSWVDDPWVHGSYAAFAPGQYTQFWGFLRERERNVVYAGEHTSTHSQGYMNGGVESGERAARQVLRTLGLQLAG